MSQDESGRGVSQLCCFSHSKYILHNSFIDFVTDDNYDVKDLCVLPTLL